MQEIEISYKEATDWLVAKMSEMPQLECKLKHVFTPGLYSRQILMPKGARIVSKTHKTKHQYNVSYGIVSVWTEQDGEVLIEAPFTGITETGTRRILYAHSDVVWTTYHPTNVVPESDSEEDILKAVDKVEEIIIQKNENKFLENKTN